MIKEINGFEQEIMKQVKESLKFIKEIEYKGEKIILYTDMDGTFFDHYTYQPTGVEEPAKVFVEKNGILRPVTSKTAAEMIDISDGLKEKNISINSFIIEGGAGFYSKKDHYPENHLKKMARDYEYYYEFDPNSGYEKVFFSKIGIHEIIKTCFKIVKMAKDKLNLDLFLISFDEYNFQKQTGLDDNQLHLAMQRDRSEGIGFVNPDEAKPENISGIIELAKSLNKNIVAKMGGRFISVTGGSDKGKAVEFTKKCDGFGCLNLGIGDSKNDEPFLRIVDYSFLVKSANGEHKDLDVGDIHKLPFIGPESVGFLLKLFNKRFKDYSTNLSQ
ncbi:MAG: hypothetical protein GF335_01695 [Candidatus Moranbacteria bacterium]|nr:hypothetical protein [Candidatus Moranbacteria bacterium]